MKNFGTIFRLVLCLSVVAFALGVPTSSAVVTPPPPPPPAPAPPPPTLQKPASQLVTLETGGDLCPGEYAENLDTLQNPDATLGSFSIPTGQVLVITDAEARARAGGAGHDVVVGLIRIKSNFVVNDIVFAEGVSNSAGTFSAVFNFPTGVVVKSGVSLCVEAFDNNTEGTLTVPATVHGYLAAEQ